MADLTAVTESLRKQLPALGSFIVPFALVLGLALESGGYDIVTRTQFGIVVWWVILLAVAIGVVPLVRVTRAGWGMLAILGGLTAWTALATLTWTDSTERSVIETSRLVTTFGFLLLLLLFQGRDGMRGAVGGIGAAVAVVALVAVASRYHPGWFDLGELPVGYPISRLSYPVGYWNGLAALMAIGLPALAWASAEARNMALRAVAAAAIPLVILATYMTASRGGIGAMVLSSILLLVIYPRRLNLLASLAVPLAASGFLVWLLGRYPELRDNLGGVALEQGDTMTWLTLGVLLVVGCLAWFIQARVLGRLIEIPEVARSTTRKLGYVVGALVLVACVVAVASGTVADRWNEFKQPVTTDPTVDRLTSLSSGERYENWRTAIDAGVADPVTGSGPGTFEYLWSRNGDGSIFVRDAHSLYFEAFGEMGIPGLLLVLALVLGPIAIAVIGAIRLDVGARRPVFAAAAAGMGAFALGAAADWSWEMAVLVAAFLAYAAAVCSPDAELRGGRAFARDLKLPLLGSSRVGLTVAAVVAIVVIYIPMKGTTLLRDSQSNYRDGDLAGALAKADDSRKWNPWSASAAIQESQLEAEAGDTSAAFEAARDATDLDPMSWKAWQVLADMAAADDRPEIAEEALLMVDELNYQRRNETVD